MFYPISPGLRSQYHCIITLTGVYTGLNPAAQNHTGFGQYQQIKQSTNAVKRACPGALNSTDRYAVTGTEARRWTTAAIGIN